MNYQTHQIQGRCECHTCTQLRAHPMERVSLGLVTAEDVLRLKAKLTAAEAEIANLKAQLEHANPAPQGNQKKAFEAAKARAALGEK